VGGISSSTAGRGKRRVKTSGSGRDAVECLLKKKKKKKNQYIGVSRTPAEDGSAILGEEMGSR